MSYPVICVEFDSTIVQNKFPDIGDPLPGAIDSLKEFVELGGRLVLWTSRGEPMPPKEGESEPEEPPRNYLEEAVEFLRDQGVDIWGVNENRGQKYYSTSKKIIGSMYIDKRAVGCPCVQLPDGSFQVDWDVIRKTVSGYLRSVKEESERKKREKKLATQPR
jgi:hypothetical protein